MSTPNDPYGYDPYDPYGQPPSYPAQGYPGAQAYPGYPAPPVQVDDPDSAMGIVGLILTFVCCGPVGLVVSWMALNKSKARGYKNTVALIGTILGGAYTALLVVVILFYAVIFIIALSTSSHSTSSLLSAF